MDVTSLYIVGDWERYTAISKPEYVHRSRWHGKDFYPKRHRVPKRSSYCIEDLYQSFNDSITNIVSIFQ